MSKDKTKENQISNIDYKDVKTLREFTNPHGRMFSRKRTNLSAKQQRQMDTAVKRARFMGLLPFIER